MCLPTYVPQGDQVGTNHRSPVDFKFAGRFAFAGKGHANKLGADLLTWNLARERHDEIASSRI